ncbi:hypothetical protein [Sphingomonas daechungensis]|uniref:hypothetical protein n=1 Tax=Sphingomonas daechungensis TaxID=1176646 RepID=UPI0037DA73CB
MPFGLVYQTSSETLERLPEIVAGPVDAVKNCKLVRCCALAFGPSSIDCEIVYDDRTRDPDSLARHRSEIIVNVKRAFESEGIAFAYPTQTSFTAAPDGSFIMPYAERGASGSEG